MIEFDANGRDPNGFACCKACGYAYKTPACDNPACEANPSISDATKARRREERVRKQAQEDQWAADRALRRKAGAMW